MDPTANLDVCSVDTESVAGVHESTADVTITVEEDCEIVYDDDDNDNEHLDFSTMIDRFRRGYADSDDPRFTGNITLLEQRLSTNFQAMTDWDQTKFDEIVGKHVDAVWGPKSKKIDQLKVVIAAIATVLSAALNVWFLTNTITDKKRDSSEHYNLTEWVLLCVETFYVYYLLCWTLGFIATACFTLGVMRLHYLGVAVRWSNMVGGFSMLLGLKVLTLSKLYHLIRFYYAFAKLLWVKCCTAYWWGRYLPHSDVRECDRAEVLNAIKEWKEHIAGGMMYGSCVAILCGPILYLPIFLRYFAVSLLPLFAPIAFLLKLRQVAFVSTVYWKSWSMIEWFRFFGVVNNVIGLTTSDDALIGGYTRLMIENSIDEKYKFGDFLEVRKALKYLIRKSVYEKTDSLIVTAMILNSWRIDPDRWMAFLRGYTPKGKTEDAETQEEFPLSWNE